MCVTNSRSFLNILNPWRTHMNESCHTHQVWKSTFKVCHELEESSQTHTWMSHVTHTWYATSIWRSTFNVCHEPEEFFQYHKFMTHMYGWVMAHILGMEVYFWSVSRTRGIITNLWRAYKNESCHAHQIWKITFKVCHELEEFFKYHKFMTCIYEWVMSRIPGMEDYL